MRYNKTDTEKRDEILSELKEFIGQYGKYVGSQLCSPGVAEYMDEEAMRLLMRSLKLCVSLTDLAEIQFSQLDRIENTMDSIEEMCDTILEDVQQEGGDR